MGKLAFNRLLNIQKCLLEIADLRMRTIAEQTLHTCGCGANEFNFRCGFALCGAKKIFATPSTAYLRRKSVEKPPLKSSRRSINGKDTS